MKTMPVEKRVDAHHWLIWHGRKICKAPTPRCEQCFLTPYCHYFNGIGKWRGQKVTVKGKPAAKKPATKKKPAPKQDAP